MKRLMIGLMVLSGALAAQAGETWTQISSMARYVDQASYDMSCWKDGSGTPGQTTTELNAGDDYVTAMRFCIYTTDRTFPGNSLTVRNGGQISFTGRGVLTCANLILENGALLDEYESMSDAALKSGYLYTPIRFQGKMTVADGATATCKSDYNGRGQQIDSALYGGKTAVIQIGSTTMTRKNSLWRFTDAANFQGEIRVQSWTGDNGYPTSDLYGTNFNYGVELSGTDMPGTIRVYGPNSVLFIPSVDNDASVGTLVLDDGAVIRCGNNRTTAAMETGLLTVKNALTVNGKVSIRATTQKGVSGTEAYWPILKGPKDVRLDVGQFVFEPNPQWAATDQPLKPIVTTDADGCDVLALYLPKETISCPDTPGELKTVDGLVFGDGTALSFKFDPSNDADTEKARSGCIAVEGPIVHDGVIPVKAVFKPVASTTGEPLSTTILTAPAGALSADMFAFVPDPAYEDVDNASDKRHLPQRIHFAVTTAGGRDTLTAVVEPVVTLVSSQDKAKTEINQVNWTVDFARADVWSDGRVPHAGAHYVKYSGYGDSPIGLFDFPGLSLSYSAATFSFHTTNQETRILNFRVGSGTLLTDNVSDIRLVGKRLEVQRTLNLKTWNARGIKIGSEIVGSGDLVLQTGTHGTSFHAGDVELTGSNTNFTGRILATEGNSSDWTPRYYGTGVQGYKTFSVGDGRNLGGELSVFAYNALALGNFTRLFVTNDVVLASGLNRGIFIDAGVAVEKQGIPGGAIVSVNDGQLTVNWPLTMSVTNACPVTLWKDCEGTLALGGGVRFLTAEGVADELPAGARQPVLCITNGCLRALSSDCVDGLTVDLAENAQAKILVDYSAADDGFRRDGIRNVKTGVPFGAGAIRIVVDGLPELTREGARFGLLAVKKSVGDAVAARLSVTRPRVPGFTKRIVREDVGDETRFYLDYRESGLLVIVR